jgi:hypothetical protein
MSSEQVVRVESIEASPVSKWRGAGLSRVWRVFFEPTKVFGEILVRPTWVWPVVAMVLVTIATQLVASRRIDYPASYRHTMQQLGMASTMSEAELEKAAESQKAPGAVRIALAPAGILVVLLISAGLYWLGLKLFTSGAGFGAVFSVAAHAVLPLAVIRGILQVVFLLPQHGLLEFEAQQVVKSNLGAILQMDVLSPLGVIASAIDVFGAWQFVLAAIGLAIVGRVSRARAIVVVAAVFLLFVLMSAGMVALPRMFAGR